MKPGYIYIALLVETAVFGALLFGAAGTLRWPGAWAYLLLFLGWAAQMVRMLARDDPELLRERSKPLFQREQPVWDRIVLAYMGVLFAGGYVLMGLDAVRFHWSAVPAWCQVIGGIGVAAGMAICYRALQENTFMAPVVKIQAERGQHVISTGPYAIIRHPLYAGALVLFWATPLLLGSLWGLVQAALLTAGLMVRAALEERELAARLEGYPEYMGRVRWRFVPGVW